MAQDAVSAKRFVESLYRPYANHGKGLDFNGAKAKRYFDRSLNVLLDADAKAVGPNEVGPLDGDPICGCQDWDGVWDLKIAIRTMSGNRAQATVSFALFAPNTDADRDLRLLEIGLVREAGLWRIDNIVDKSDPKNPSDLRADLDKQIRRPKQPTPAKPSSHR